MTRKPITSGTRGAFQRLVDDIAAHRRQKGPKVLLTTESKVAQLRQSIRSYSRKPKQSLSR